MLGRFFKLPRTKQFTIKTRYYDERKDALDKRVAQIKSEMGITDDNPEGTNQFKGDYRSHIKGQMRGYFKHSKREHRASNRRLLIILLILFGITWYIFFF